MNIILALSRTNDFVGFLFGTSGHKQNTGAWQTVNDHPFGTGSGLAYYDQLYIPETSSYLYLVIGGFDGDDY